MIRISLLLLLLCCVPLCAVADHPEAEPGLISAQIVDLIDTADPVLLDIQAGDLTSEIDYKVRQLLLEKGADLREMDATAMEGLVSPNGETADINSHLLAAANLVKISMELGGVTIEQKGFLTYRSQRYPLYTFQIRQIAIPGYSLRKIDSLSFVDRNLKAESQPMTTIKWFEPVLASTALASIIYLLWTTE
jgi:hypothetical protein